MTALEGDSPTADAKGADAHARLSTTLERILSGSTRSEIVDGALDGGVAERAVRRLRSALRTHTFQTPERVVTLRDEVAELDQRTRAEGFQVLQAWDFQKHRFTDDNIAVLMLDFARREEFEVSRTTLAIVLDHYFLYLLALLAMRAWDTSDPDGALGRVGGLLDLLQGPAGSGHQFVADPETLLVLAVSYFHPEEAAYDRLIDRVRTLDGRHRTTFALPSAAALGSHLRWGMAVMYRWDVGRMRDDNVGDYPWLLFSVSTLMRAFAQMVESGEEGPGRRELVHGLLNGMSVDPWAFVGKPPPALVPHAEEHAECLALIREHRDALLDDFRAHRPVKDPYSPIALQVNFPNNALVAGVTVAVLEAAPQDLSLNALFGARQRGIDDEARLALALRFSQYAGSSRERLDAHGAPLIMYAPRPALRGLNLTMSALKKL